VLDACCSTFTLATISETGGNFGVGSVALFSRVRRWVESLDVVETPF